MIVGYHGKNHGKMEQALWRGYKQSWCLCELCDLARRLLLFHTVISSTLYALVSPHRDYAKPTDSSLLKRFQHPDTAFPFAWYPTS